LSNAEQRAVGLIPAWSPVTIILKSGGIKNALTVLIDTNYQATFSTGRNSKQSCVLQRESSLMIKHEIASSNKRPWDLMNWIWKKPLPAIETISYKNYPYNTLLDL